MQMTWEMMPRRAALAGGCFFTLFGILGLVPPLHENWPSDEPALTVRNGRGFLFGIFPNNAVLALMHLSMGVWGLLMSRGARSARTFNRTALVVFGALAVLGLLSWVNSLAGVIPTFGATALLHTGTALALVGVAIATRALTKGSRPASPTSEGRAITADWLHGFLSVFPLAFLTAVVASDLAHWWTTMDWYVDYEGFWGTASIWLLGSGLAGGALGSIAGLMDLRHRRELTGQRVVSVHIAGSIGALLLTVVNLLIRVADHEARIIPWGILLSLAAAGMVVYHGWYVGNRMRLGEREPLDHGRRR